MTNQPIANAVEVGDFEEDKYAVAKAQLSRLAPQMTRVASRCDRICADLAGAIEECQQQLAKVVEAFPVDEAPWRLPAGLTFQEDESDWGRGVQFLSKSIVQMDRVRSKLSDLAFYHCDSIVEADIEQVVVYGPQETLALKRLFELAMAAAKGAQEACLALQALASGPEEINENWYEISLLSGEIQFYAESIPGADALYAMGQDGPYVRHFAHSCQRGANAGGMR